MSKKLEKKVNLETKIVFDDLTIEDKELIYKLVPMDKKYQVPQYSPVEDENGRNVIFSTLDAKIIDDQSGEVTEVTDFYITYRQKFNRKASNAINILTLFSAIDDPDKTISGGVYLRGKLATKNNREFFHKYFFGKLVNRFFTVEDGDMIFDYLPRDLESGYPLYWPKYNSKHEDISYSAVKATNVDKSDPNNIQTDISFDIYPTELFDLNDPQTITKIQIIRDLLNDNKIVTGFYYKGKLVPKKLSIKYKEAFERTLIRKNFTLEDRKYLLAKVTRDPKNNMPLFWPQVSRDGSRAVISVVNYINHGKVINFDIFEDETLDLKNPKDAIKYKVIKDIIAHRNNENVGLYYRGNLLFGALAVRYENSRLKKLEETLGYAIFTNAEKDRMNKEFTVNDTKKLIHIINAINKKIDPITGFPIFLEPLKTQKIRIAVLAEDLTDIVVATKDDIIDVKNTEILKSSLTNLNDDRGVYYKGKLVPGLMSTSEVLKVISKIEKEFSISLDINPEIIEQKVNAISKKYLEIKNGFNYTMDKKSHMPKYWPTYNEKGRKVLLSVVDSSIFFHSGRVTIKASNDINFDVYVGETFGLVGESGSGKTTISRAVLGLNKLTSGAIYFHGELISSNLKGAKRKTVKSKIQMIFQDPAASLNDRANVDYIVSEGLESFGLYENQADRLQKVETMMERVGLLPEHLSRFPHEFSGGQRQRIGIARALIVHPELVLADEPISALDVSIRAQVLNLLKDLQREDGLTYIFVAHDLSIIRYISDRVAVMHQGYIVEMGPAEEIYKNPVHPYTRSLLTAIPQPDPNSEYNRVRIAYDKGTNNYARDKWMVVGDHHYVLSNNKLLKEWQSK